MRYLIGLTTVAVILGSLFYLYHADEPPEMEKSEVSYPPRSFILGISYLVLPQDGADAVKTLKNLATGEVYRLGPEMEIGAGKYQMELPAGSYSIHLEREGYEVHEERIEIPPEMPLYYYRYNFRPSARKFRVVLKQAGKEPGPDSVLADGKPLSDLILPGTYQITIAKDGYQSRQEKITVPVGPGEYVVERELSPLKRPVLLAFVDRSLQRRASPDTVLLNGSPIYEDIVLQLQPATYRLEASGEGYVPLQTEIEVPAGGSLLVVPLFLDQEPVVSCYRLEFQLSLPGSKILLDDISYSYEAEIDGSPVPGDEAVFRDNGEEVEAYLRLPPASETLRIYRGYCYAEYSVLDVPDRVPSLDGISATRLQRHFEALQDRGESTSGILLFFDQPANVKQLKATSRASEIEELLAYLRKCALPPEKMREIEEKIAE